MRDHVNLVFYLLAALLSTVGLAQSPLPLSSPGSLDNADLFGPSSLVNNASAWIVDPDSEVRYACVTYLNGTSLIGKFRHGEKVAVFSTVMLDDPCTGGSISGETLTLFVSTGKASVLIYQLNTVTGAQVAPR